MSKLKGAVCLNHSNILSTTSQKPTAGSPSPHPTKGTHWEKRPLNTPKLFFSELLDPYTLFKPSLVHFNKCWWKNYRKQIQKMLKPQDLEIHKNYSPSIYFQKDTKQIRLPTYPYCSNCGMYTHLHTTEIKNMNIVTITHKPIYVYIYIQNTYIYMYYVYIYSYIHTHSWTYKINSQETSKYTFS